MWQHPGPDTMPPILGTNGGFITPMYRVGVPGKPGPVVIVLLGSLALRCATPCLQLPALPHHA
eukprot:3548538-Lingulodinium_polyedra.AAC.1